MRTGPARFTRSLDTERPVGGTAARAGAVAGASGGSTGGGALAAGAIGARALVAWAAG